MNFRTIRDSIVQILGAAAASRYRVIGYQEQNRDALEVVDNSRLVEVFYSDGDFPKQGGSINGPVMHDMTFQIHLTCSKYAEGALDVLESDTSTPAEKATALANFKQSAKLADDSMDELFEIVYQVLMNAQNYDLGMTFPVADRWVDQFQKDTPTERGELVVLTSSLRLTARIDEQVDGEVGVGAEIIDFTLDLEGDDVERTGIIIDDTLLISRNTGEVLESRNTGELLTSRSAE